WNFPGENHAAGVRLSPDGQRLAYPEGHVDELARGVVSDIGRGGLVWSPDGSRLLFDRGIGSQRQQLVEIGGQASTDRKWGIYQKSSSGPGAEELLLASEAPDTTLVPSSWSSDGRFILYNCHQGVQSATHVRSEIWVLPVVDDRKPRLFVK